MIANIPRKNMICGKKEEERYNEETRCWICKGEFDDKDKNKRAKMALDRSPDFLRLF